MADEIVYKKVTRKADKGLEGKIVAKHGKQTNQKLKPYLVLQYLLKYSDENNTKTAYDIIGYLEDCGISADRRSIYRDIEDINRIMLMLQEDIDLGEVDAMFAEAEESSDEEDLNALKTVLYNKNRKGFYVRQRRYDHNDMRLLAECVYSAKFLSLGQAERLANVVCEFVSEEQAKLIRHDALLMDRVKTDNKSVLHSISTINDAMSKKLDGQKHEPEKIRFRYLEYSIKDVGQQVERRQGKEYVVSPYKLVINDGNYYLLSFDDRFRKMRTYRLDRMKGVERTGEPRDGSEAFAAIDMSTYTKRVFSMFDGKLERVTIQFINILLDAVVDQFGNDKNHVHYAVVDEGHFSVTTYVAVSDQFFGWLFSFGRRAKLIGSDAAVEKFRAYLEKVREMYHIEG